MKVLKDVQHSLLFKPFGLQNKNWLSLGVMLWFDLDAPDPVLTEQDMWQTLSEELPEDIHLDIGMPKGKAEVLVHGVAHAPEGKLVQGLSVVMQVGGLHKRLMVFGDRQWERGVISRPEPFTKMELVYERAFGGPDFERNPKGKGAAPVRLPDGEVIHPLPNIENPDNLSLMATDRPDPAGFHPLDITWPQRRKKEGTFDKKWQDEVHPGLPLDTAEDFFNAAPEDQQIDGFFKPGDQLSIQNMHPKDSLIQSHLPRTRLRFFVTKKENLTQKDAPEYFEEVKNKIDTVWLFPGLKRGVALYRGVTETLDDEFADVTNIFIASESLDEEAKPLEYFLEEKRKRLDRTVPVDAAPAQKAEQAIATAAKRIKNIEKSIQAAKQRALGKAPLFKTTGAQMSEAKEAVLGAAFMNLDNMESMLQGMRATHGARVPDMTEKFTQIRGQLAKASKTIDKVTQSADKLRAQKAEKVQNLGKALKDNIPEAVLAEKGIDPDNPMGEAVGNPWHERGFFLVTQWRHQLNQAPLVVKTLRSAGFFRRTLNRFWLGLSPALFKDELRAWGLDGEWFEAPAGLVLPRFHGAALTGVRIRPFENGQAEIADTGRDVIVPGSDTSPLVLSRPGNHVVVLVKDEFEALLLEQEVGDFADVLVVNAPGGAVGQGGAELLADALTVAACLPEGEKPDVRAAWEGAYQNGVAHCLPVGKNCFEAHANGVDIREWVLEAMAQATREEQSFLPQEEADAPEGKKAKKKRKFPRLDAAAIIGAFTTELKAVSNPVKERLLGLRQNLEDQVKDTPPFQQQKPFDEPGEQNPQKQSADMKKQFLQDINARRRQLKAIGKLTPDVDGDLTAMEQDISKMAADYGSKMTDGLTLATQARNKAKASKAAINAGELPENMVKKFRDAGIDLEKRKRLTRDEVIARLENKAPLDGVIVSGEDLSGLDFSGLDLSGISCVETNFQKSNFTGAKLAGISGKKADFSDAVMREANLTKAMCGNAVFKGADMGKARLDKCVFKGADFTGADLAGAEFNMSNLEDTRMQHTVLDGCTSRLTVFSGSDAANASFVGARLTKNLFKNVVLTQADFSKAALSSCMFQDAGGQAVKFNEGVLYKCGIVQSEFPGVDFSKAVANLVLGKESGLRGAVFDASVLDDSQFESCDLADASFVKASAKRCRFSRSDLRNADLKAANLYLSSLRKAHLANTSFRAANLFAVDLFQAKILNTNFELANLRRTVLENRTDLIETS